MCVCIFLNARNMFRLRLLLSQTYRDRVAFGCNKVTYAKSIKNQMSETKQ